MSFAGMRLFGPCPSPAPIRSKPGRYVGQLHQVDTAWAALQSTYVFDQILFPVGERYATVSAHREIRAPVDRERSPPWIAIGLRRARKQAAFSAFLSLDHLVPGQRTLVQEAGRFQGSSGSLSVMLAAEHPA
jgi:hypothetical protein